MQHNAYFTDVFTSNGVTFEFFYTKQNGNRWAVRASIATAQGGIEFYAVTHEHPESLEALIATHRHHVADIVASWATALKPKGQHND